MCIKIELADVLEVFAFNLHPRDITGIQLCEKPKREAKSLTIWGSGHLQTMSNFDSAG
jgi:hypothetical protein